MGLQSKPASGYLSTGSNRPILSPKGKDIAEAALQLIQARDTLGPEAQSRLENTFLQSANTMLQAAQRNDALAQLPIGIPDTIPKRVWRRRRLTDLLTQQD
jgi:hypothetical protein